MWSDPKQPQMGGGRELFGVPGGGGVCPIEWDVSDHVTVM